MSAENKSGVAEKELADSDDDSFEVLDPESEQEGKDYKHISRNDFTNAGTIIFCHMDDEYNSIHQVSCQYIRPEGWNEQESDQIAIFEVGWINTEEALAKIPVDRNISKGYPLGSVDLKDFAFCKEEYVARPGELSYFQFCYLRDGVLLGASTPFGIRGIKALRHLPSKGGKPLFLRRGEISIDRLIAKDISSYALTAFLDTDLNPNPCIQSPNVYLNNSAQKEAAYSDSNASTEEEISLLESALDNLVQVKHLLNQTANDKVSEWIVGLTQSIDELKAKQVLPSDTLTGTASFPETDGDIEQRFKSCAMHLKESSPDRTSSFDVCKHDETIPALSTTDCFSLPDTNSLDVPDKCYLGPEQLHESENDQLKEKGFAEAVSKQLLVKVAELNEELVIKESDLLKSEDMLCSAESKLRVASEQLLNKESECEELKKSCGELRSVNEGMVATITELSRRVEDAQRTQLCRENKLKAQTEYLMKMMEGERKEWEIKESSHKRYVAEVEAKRTAVSEECDALRSEITTLQEEAKLYKSKLGETIVELANSREETDDLSTQCKKLVEHLDFLESEKTRLMGYIDTLKEKLESKRCEPSQLDVLIQEFLKKAEELHVARQQVENFQDELSRLNVQRTTLQNELLQARQNPATCEKPCCTYEVDPTGKHTDSVLQSILEALEQSIQENKRLQSELDEEKTRSQSLDDKLQSAAGIQRSLYVEKISLERRLAEFLGRDDTNV